MFFLIIGWLAAVIFSVICLGGSLLGLAAVFRFGSFGGEGYCILALALLGITLLYFVFKYAPFTISFTGV